MHFGGGHRLATFALLACVGIALAGCGAKAALTTTSTTTKATTTLPPTTVGPPLPPGTPPAPKALLARVRAAIANAPGVHVVGNQTISGVAEQFIDDLGIRTGDESLSSNGARLEVRLTATRAYLFGNAEGFVSFFGAPSGFSPPDPIDWYYADTTDPEFEQYKDQLSVNSFDNDYLPAKQPVTDAKAVLNGKDVYALEWKETPDKSGLLITLYVPMTGAPLPIEETAVSSTAHQVTQFSKWGESIVVEIPSPSVPIAQLFG